MQRYIIAMNSMMARRLKKLEARRPVRVRGPLVDFACLSVEAQVLWAAYDGDVERMTLAELDVLAAELLSFTE
jgi:hypothetical protein